jgi:hypothetical protein
MAQSSGAESTSWSAKQMVVARMRRLAIRASGDRGLADTRLTTELSRQREDDDRCPPGALAAAPRSLSGQLTRPFAARRDSWLSPLHWRAFVWMVRPRPAGDGTGAWTRVGSGVVVLAVWRTADAGDLRQTHGERREPRNRSTGAPKSCYGRSR